MDATKTKLFRIAISLLLSSWVLTALAGCAEAGGIAGTIRDAQTLAPIVGIDLDVFDANFNFIPAVGATSLDDGSYLLSPLPAGNYFVRADPTRVQGYVDQYHDGVFLKSQATAVAVATFGTVIVDFNLLQGGTISGHIWDVDTNAPLDNIDLDVYDLNRVFIPSVDTRSTVDGSYILGNFPPGTYYVKADPDPAQMYVQTYYDNKELRALADSVVMTGLENIPNIDFHLTSGGIINGIVTDATTGLPLQGIDIDIFDTLGVSLAYANDTTSTPGAYTVGAVKAGDYYVRADPSLSQYYVDTYYGQSFYRSTATRVRVVAGAATDGTNIALAPGGTYSGIVTKAGTGEPLSDLHITLFDTFDTIVHYGSGHTKTDGTFLFGAVPPGTYFARCDGSAPLGLAFQLYSGIILRSQATPIAVAAGSNSANINFSLQPGGWIAGTILDYGAGVPAPGIDLDVYATNQEYIGALNATTDSAGDYLLGPAPQGGYFVKADPPDTNIYSVQYFDHRPTVGAATAVSVTPGQTRSSVDFDMFRAGVPGGWLDAADEIHCHPNPFNPSVVITYCLPKSGLMDLGIYDVRGRQVRTLASGQTPAGSYSVTWDSRKVDGQSVPPGVYFIQLRVIGRTVSQKVVLLE